MELAGDLNVQKKLEILITNKYLDDGLDYEKIHKLLENIKTSMFHKYIKCTELKNKIIDYIFIIWFMIN